MKTIFRLLCLIVCISFAFGQKTLTTYQEPVEIYPLIEPIPLSEPSWSHPISDSNSELHDNTILLNNNGTISLLDIQSGNTIWQYENPIRKKFISSNGLVLILDNNIFKTIDITSGAVINELVIDAKPPSALSNVNTSDRFVRDYTYKDSILYINVSSIEEGGQLQAYDMSTSKVIWTRYKTMVRTAT